MRDRAVLPASVVGVACVGAGSALAAMAGRFPEAMTIGIALAAAHAVGLATTSGRRVPLTVGVAAAASVTTGASLPVMIAAGLIGLPIGSLIAVVDSGSRTARELFPSEPVAYTVFAVIASLIEGVVPHGGGAAGWTHLAVAASGALGWFTADTLVRAATAGSRRRLGRRLLLRRSMAEWQAFAALVAVGSIFGLTLPSLGWWAVPLAAVPYLFGHLALERAQRTRTTYRQTIRALGRIPEAGGFSVPGHADRCADLAVAMGSELGLSSSELEHVEEAALLHDLGRLVLNDPAVAGGGYSTRDLAQWSAAIVAEVPHLRPAAELVGNHYLPYRRSGEAKDGTVAPAAQIVKISSAFSVAVGGGMSRADALEILHQGAAYDYDPELVALLRRVLDRRGDAVA